VKTIDDMTPEELEVVGVVFADLYGTIVNTLLPVLEAMKTCLLKAGIMDADGNLTESAKQLLKEAKK